jgi:ribosomal protein L37AE/L43A
MKVRKARRDFRRRLCPKCRARLAPLESHGATEVWVCGPCGAAFFLAADARVACVHMLPVRCEVRGRKLDAYIGWTRRRTPEAQKVRRWSMKLYRLALRHGLVETRASAARRRGNGRS